ncbi:Holliday junction branch migration protein RuvA [Desulfofundulus thermobenzoicus]|uniref:Holliday junction branch migration complex subunit RuvA n=1 Tax=Desulfofundulus thermobenzoicus TaxID=29376 RepID=A0A6N7IVT5_9FIRM|nr:Holliday junction branch migration protein RuvA [Desulfofundulus thermobenzoicus]MQL53703.1 Holliday junction branch migration protein RuvA [Desulfofundulus thermobenzoicus]
MIARICGILKEVQNEGVIVDVHGVGYLVRVPRSTMEKLPARGQEVELHTHLIWREDGPALYGFDSREELSAFRFLLHVSGVGPRVALSILSAVTPDILNRAVSEENDALLTRVPGIGKKTARRIILELKDRLGAVPFPAAAAQRSTEESDAVAALVALGYTEVDAHRVVQAVCKEAPGLPVEGLIRAALQRLGRS